MAAQPMNVHDAPVVVAKTDDTVQLNYAGFWVRLLAGLIDFTVLLVPFSTVVSFAAMGMKVWYSFFFGMRPGQPLPEDLAREGPILVLIGVFFSFLVDGFILGF
jgi:hypothetical protein